MPWRRGPNGPQGARGHLRGRRLPRGHWRPGPAQQESGVSAGLPCGSSKPRPQGRDFLGSPKAEVLSLLDLTPPPGVSAREQRPGLPRCSLLLPRTPGPGPRGDRGSSSPWQSLAGVLPRPACRSQDQGWSRGVRPPRVPKAYTHSAPVAKSPRGNSDQRSKTCLRGSDPQRPGALPEPPAPFGTRWSFHPWAEAAP